jgi:1-carboxybiuret hydrolase subunit AtzG-like protein
MLDQFIAAAAHALALPVEAAWKGAVKANLEVALRLAASFADFPLPDDAEPAPVFTA